MLIIFLVAQLGFFFFFVTSTYIGHVFVTLNSSLRVHHLLRPLKTFQNMFSIINVLLGG